MSTFDMIMTFLSMALPSSIVLEIALMIGLISLVLSLSILLSLSLLSILSSFDGSIIHSTSSMFSNIES